MTTAQREWLRLAIATIGLAGSLVTVFLIISARDWRLDLTPAKRFVLSDHARRILGDLDRDVQIVAFLRPDDPRNPDIEDLLHRVARASAHAKTQVLDVNRNPALARTYGVSAYGAVVVQTTERRVEFTTPTEEALMAAIVQATRPGRRHVYFLTGHRERSIRTISDRGGYSSARVALMTEGYGVGECGLLGDRPVPDDATVLIVAGPRRGFAPEELPRLDAFVRGGGSLLVLLDPGDAPDLVTFLRRYGIAVSDEVVLDADNRLFAGDYLTTLVPERNAAHPVGAALQAPALMSQIRAVDVVPSDLTIEVVDVVRSAPESWRTTDLDVLRTGTGTFAPGRDRRGPVSIGVGALVATDGTAPGRVLVYGDADFAANAFLGYLGNRDLLLNSVNWLAREESRVGIRAPDKVPGVQQFFVSDRQGRQAFWFGTVLQPAVVLVIGLVIVVRRRRNG